MRVLSSKRGQSARAYWGVFVDCKDQLRRVCYGEHPPVRFCLAQLHVGRQ